ncbi:MAG: DUF4279 domain-containing protein [Thermoleophilia bacterium]
MKKYDDKYATCARTYATLRVFHENLDPDEISKILGISYTRAYRKGDPHSKANPETVKRHYGAWLLDSKHHVNSRDSRRHIDWLLDQLEERSEAIHYLFSEGCKIDFFCFWESAHGHGGPTISPNQSTRLGKMNIDLMFDVYFSCSE